MLRLSKSTEFNKRIPKQKFYENLSITPAIRKDFSEQIKTIYWRNKLAATTLNISSGEQVTEIEVFEVKLASPNLDENVLQLIDREIPYHILFLLAHDGKCRAVMGYKEAATLGKNTFKVERYYYTEWISETEMPIRLEGLTLDAIYENFIRQIAGNTLRSEESATLKDSIERQKRMEQIEKQIATLEGKIKKERQPKKKFDLVNELKQLQDDVKQLGGR